MRQSLSIFTIILVLYNETYEKGMGSPIPLYNIHYLILCIFSFSKPLLS